MIQSFNDNTTNRGSKIKYNEKKDTLKTLWNKLDKKMRTKCINEFCWTSKLKNTGLIRTNDFRPLIPSEWIRSPTTWLDTNNINNVLTQYELSYPIFKYMGASPIDFDYKYKNDTCVVKNICEIDVANLLLIGKKSIIGFIFNLDKHNQGGSHWVSMVVNLKTGNIYYYDSFGNGPPNEIIVLINKIKDQLKVINISCDFGYNTKQHQFRNTECGMYSMYFIITLLISNKTLKYSFNHITNKNIRDKKMVLYRKKLFIPHKYNN
jgi:hypothetical protein